MTLQEFKESLKNQNPDEALSPSLAALWWDAKGSWEKAHDQAQEDKGPAGAWVHAYLHRKEGDLSNANYWYTRANQPESKLGLDEEWREITNSLLANKRPGGRD